MKKDNSGSIPAWMVTQALVIKAKNVLIEESIELLYKEIDAKRMKISGSFMPMELEKDGEMEQGLFLIQHLLDEKPNIMKSISAEIKALEAKKLDADAIQRIESAKKFMLAVEQIAALTTYGMVFEQWFNDVSMRVKERNPALILAKSAGGRDSHRAEALRFLVKSKMFRSDTFTKDEMECFSKALESMN